MWGVGLWELTVIAIVAIVVFGPERLPEFARQAGRFVRTFRMMATNARDELRRELGPEYADLELRDLDPRTLVKKHIIDVANEDLDGVFDISPDGPAEKSAGKSGGKPGGPRFARDPVRPRPEGSPDSDLATPYDPEAT